MKTPLDESPATDNWLALRWFLFALQGALRGRALLIAAASLIVGVAAAKLIAWPFYEADRAVETRSLDQPTGVMLEVPPTFWVDMGAWDFVSYATLIATPVESDASYWLKLLASLASLFVATIAGVSLSRFAAAHLTHHKLASAKTALSYGLRHGPWVLAGLLVLLAFVGLLVGVLWLAGVASRMYVIGVIEAILLPVLLLVAIVAAVLTIGVVAGGPLMIAATAVETPDPFDAVGRGLAYVWQRPLRWLAYVAQAALVGAIACGLLRWVLGVAMMFLQMWATGQGDRADNSGSPFAADAIDFWMETFAWIPVILAASYFWFATTALYLLLRREVDEKQVDDVSFDDASIRA